MYMDSYKCALHGLKFSKRARWSARGSCQVWLLAVCKVISRWPAIHRGCFDFKGTLLFYSQGDALSRCEGGAGGNDKGKYIVDGEFACICCCCVADWGSWSCWDICCRLLRCGILKDTFSISMLETNPICLIQQCKIIQIYSMTCSRNDSIFVLNSKSSKFIIRITHL